MSPQRLNRLLLASGYLLANIRILVVALILAFGLANDVNAQVGDEPDTIVVPSGALELRALFWRPRGQGPFPGIVFNHGSGQGVLGPSGKLEHTMEWQARVLGPVFARHGYVFLYPFRRGTGLSAAQGESSSDRWENALAANGQVERNRLQIQLLENVELDDELAAVRALPEVDARRVAVVGHSFGGSLTLLVAEHDPALRAAVVFSGSARSWPLSPPLRQRLLKTVGHTVVPIFLIFAANDYSITPAEMLDAEMTRLGKLHRLKIYPAVGSTAAEGHGFVHLRVADWEPDVFAFLDPLMQ